MSGEAGRRMARWLPFFGVAMGYVLAFAVVWRVWPFSLDSPWFVVVAMICVLGLASMTRGATALRVPAPWRTVRSWESRGPVARLVRRFGRLLTTTPLRRLNTYVYRRAGERSAGRLLAELESAEASHLLSAALVVPYMVRAACFGWWDRLFWVSLAQVCVNVLPMLHLRMARAAVTRRRRSDLDLTTTR